MHMRLRSSASSLSSCSTGSECSSQRRSASIAVSPSGRPSMRSCSDVEQRVEVVEDDGLLRREVGEERARRDVGRRGDVGHGRRLEPALAEQRERGLDDLLARPLLLALAKPGDDVHAAILVSAQIATRAISAFIAISQQSVIPCRAWPTPLDVSPPRPRGIGNAPSRSSPRSRRHRRRRPRSAAAPSSTASARPGRSPSRRSTSSPSASRRSPATPRRSSSPATRARWRATRRSPRPRQAVKRQPHVTGVAPLQLSARRAHRLPHRPVRQARPGPAARARRAPRRGVGDRRSRPGLEVSRRGPIVDQAEQLSRAGRRADRPRGRDPRPHARLPQRRRDAADADRQPDRAGRRHPAAALRRRVHRLPQLRPDAGRDARPRRRDRLRAADRRPLPRAARERRQRRAQRPRGQRARREPASSPPARSSSSRSPACSRPASRSSAGWASARRSSSPRVAVGAVTVLPTLMGAFAKRLRPKDPRPSPSRRPSSAGARASRAARCPPPSPAPRPARARRAGARPAPRHARRRQRRQGHHHPRRLRPPRRGLRRRLQRPARAGHGPHRPAAAVTQAAEQTPGRRVRLRAGGLARSRTPPR